MNWLHSQCVTPLLEDIIVSLNARGMPIIQPQLGEAFCRTRCFQKFVREMHRIENVIVPQANRLLTSSWEKDKRYALLLDWLLVEGNYNAYCGGGKNSNGSSKDSFLTEIAAHIQAESGIATTRENVRNKLEMLENDFKKASDWLNSTGQPHDS
jgi:hypothetical protein